MQGQPAPPNHRNGLKTIISYGNHDLWPGTDSGGLDNLNLIWWDPNATAEDETGNSTARAMYRLVDGGRRYLPGQWPTEPIKLFDPAGHDHGLRRPTPPELQPKEYPTPPD